MGLDITAFSHLRVLNDHPWEESCWDKEHIQAFAYKGFEHSYRGLETSKHGSGTFIGERCYAPTPETQTHRFRAGSYGGYNQFRECLMELSGTGFDGPADGPFYELINFADNEGSIGPEAAADLLEDFTKHEALFKEGFPDWARSYDDWTTAFALASNGGMVQFH